MIRHLPLLLSLFFCAVVHAQVERIRKSIGLGKPAPAEETAAPDPVLADDYWNSSA